MWAGGRVRQAKGEDGVQATRREERGVFRRPPVRPKVGQGGDSPTAMSRLHEGAGTWAIGAEGGARARNKKKRWATTEKTWRHEARSEKGKTQGKECRKGATGKIRHGHRENTAGRRIK